MKKVISLIVLVITIIVMIILAATVVISLTNNSVIDRASHAVELTDHKQVQDLAALTGAELYTDGIKEQFILETKVNETLKGSGVDINKFNIEVATNGINIQPKQLELNEYGFYFDTEYSLNGYVTPIGNVCNSTAVFKEDEIYINSTNISRIWEEGISLRMVDFGSTLYVVADPLEYNKVYSGIGTLGAKCQCFVDSTGHAYDSFIISQDKITYSNKKANLSGAIIIEFSEDGKSFVFNGQTFKIAE